MTCERKDMRCNLEVATPQVRSGGNTGGITNVINVWTVDNTNNLLGVGKGNGYKGIAVFQVQCWPSFGCGRGNFRLRPSVVGRNLLCAREA